MKGIHPCRTKFNSKSEQVILRVKEKEKGREKKEKNKILEHSLRKHSNVSSKVRLPKVIENSNTKEKERDKETE